MRIALIHAVRVAIDPVEEAFERLWPEAIRMNLLDDRLSGDLTAAGELTSDISDRIGALADYASGTGADGILYTCSAFGPAIEAVQHRMRCPVLKPNEAMFEAAIARGGKIGLLASFEPSIEPMRAEFNALASGSNATLITACEARAMTALNAGDGAEHDRLLAENAGALDACDTIMLAQFSIARARASVEEATSKPVLTSPDSAVRKMKMLLNSAQG